MNYRQIKAIEAANKKRILKYSPDCTDDSGIYFLTREEGGFRYAYVGQAKHLLTRLAQHLRGYQHIDLSLKKHGFKSDDNPTGWKIQFIFVPEERLDNAEQEFIKEYANNGYQLLNKTAGGQGTGKTEIAETRPRKTYREGLAKGYENAQKEIAHYFDLYFTAEFKKMPPCKNAEKAMEKFQKFIDIK